MSEPAARPSGRGVLDTLCYYFAIRATTLLPFSRLMENAGWIVRLFEKLTKSEFRCMTVCGRNGPCAMWRGILPSEAPEQRRRDEGGSFRGLSAIPLSGVEGRRRMSPRRRDAFFSASLIDDGSALRPDARVDNPRYTISGRKGPLLVWRGILPSEAPEQRRRDEGGSFRGLSAIALSGVEGRRRMSRRRRDASWRATLCRGQFIE